MGRSSSIVNAFPGEVPDPDEVNSLQDLRFIKSVVCIDGMFYISCADGYVHLYCNDSLKMSFKAHDVGLLFMERARDSSMVLTLGQDVEQGSNLCSIKFWDFMPDHCQLLGQIAIPDNVSQGAVSLAASDDFKVIAIGSQNCLIHVVQGKDLPYNTRDVTKRNLSFDERHPTNFITNLHFLRKPSQKHLYLFVTTQNSVGLYTLYDRSEEKKMLEDNDGCMPGCSALDEEKERLMVGLTTLKSVAYYHTEFKGQTWGLEGDKLILKCFKSQCIVVSRLKNQSQLAIHDLENRYTGNVSTYTDVEHVIVDEDIIYVLFKNNRGELFFQKLTEKSAKEKLSILFKKSMFDIAYSVAKKEGFDDAFMADISRRQGDHYYKKRDFDNAINCYKQTVGYLEASYVIIQFLDFTKIDYLTSYLEFLHTKHVAENEHTALLLNCYVHMKDTDRLQKFLAQSNEDYELFNPKTAINVCCKARCFDLALNLADQHKMSAEYVKIKIEDEERLLDAIHYMEIDNKMSNATKSKVIKEYGKELMEHHQQETQLLIFNTVDSVNLKVGLNSHMDPSPLDRNERRLSTDSQGEFGLEEDNTVNTPTYRQFLENLMSAFGNHPNIKDQFLSHIIQHTPEVDSFVYHSLIEHYLQIKQQLEWAQLVPDTPRKDQKRQGVNLVTGVLKSFERKDTLGVTYYEDRLEQILRDCKDRYEKEHVLMLFQLYNYNKGVVYISALMKNQNELMYNYLKEHDAQRIWETCETYGEQDDDLWVQALTYFASRNDTDSMEYIKRILDRIERKDFLSPLIVLEILGKNKKITFGVIKNYLKEQLNRHKRHMKQDDETIRSNMQHIDQMRNEIHQLKTQARKFQGKKCANCESALYLPTVHFMCMHSYHQHCLTDNERECQKCFDEANQARMKLEALSMQSHDHETFYKELNGSKDRFETIATYFGRGLFADLQ